MSSEDRHHHDSAIGIDLGTTTCAAARLTKAGDLACFPLEEDRYLLPSALHFGTQLTVGTAALRAGGDDPESLVEAFKRDMGEPHFHREVRGHWTPPEVLSAHLLAAIRQRVQRESATRTAVITVPAYFDERRRKATFEAGRLAGLDMLDIVNEPVAAALAEMHYAKLLPTQDATEQRGSNFVVYDLGGGTFDVSVLRVEGPEIVTLASDGDVRLGGRDFDERIIDCVSEQFLARHGVDPRSDFAAIQRLWRQAVAAKHQLTSVESISVPCSYAGLELDVEITRSMFESAITPLLERTLATATDAVEQAGLTWDKIDQLLLVGGSSRVPAVSRRLRSTTGIEARLSHEPDLAVARGAALFASLGTASDLAGVNVVNVNAHSLGVAGVDPRTGEGVNRVIIPRNSRLPAAKRQKFVTKSAGQRSIKIKVVEGENENPEFCVPVGTCVATLAPDLPARTEVLVTCRLGTNGTLSVSCLVPATNQSAHVEIRRDRLLDLESLDVWRQRLTGSVPEEEALESPLSAIEFAYVAEPSLDPPLDHDAITKRIDYIGQEAASLYVKTNLGAAAEAERDRWLDAEQEYTALARLLQQVRADLRRETDQLEKIRLQASAALVRVQLEESENLLRYARVAFGSHCLQHEPTPPDAEGYADELYDLRVALKESA
ncbi:MAG: Hsp70 family protein [Planctomycetota bacterium]